MRIEANRVRTERIKKTWSQEHLAQVTRLGLRTIQRIEKTHSASLSSIKAICAALNISVAELMVDEDIDETPTTSRLNVRTTVGLFCASLVSLGAFFLGAQSFADQIMLDVAIALNDGPEEKGSLLTMSGKNAEMRLDKQVRLIVLPVLQEDGRVFLSTEVFEYQNGDYVLIGEPKLLTKNNREAQIRMTLSDGDEVRFRVTPHAD